MNIPPSPIGSSQRSSLRTMRMFHPTYGEHVLVAPAATWDQWDWTFFMSRWQGQILIGLNYELNRGQAGFHTIYSGFSWGQSWDKNFLDLLVPSFPLLLPAALWKQLQDGQKLEAYLLRPETMAVSSLVVMPLMKGNPNRAKGVIFLDRDGIINVDHGYVSDIAKIEYIPGLFELLRWAKKSSIEVIVLTNQSGIAKKMYGVDQMHSIHRYITADVLREGGEIAGFYFCPYHHEALDKNYEYYSLLRKPGPGMIYQAANDHTFSLARSMMIGDKPSDILVGGVTTMLLQGNYELDNVNGHVPIFKTLTQTLQYLQKHQENFFLATV